MTGFWAARFLVQCVDACPAAGVSRQVEASIAVPGLWIRSQNATVLSGPDMKCAMHVQKSLAKTSAGAPNKGRPTNPWLTVGH